MLSAYRRHQKDCPHKSKGAAYSLCDCTIWCYGQLPNGQTIRRSLHTSDQDECRRIVDRLERGETVAGYDSAMPLRKAADAFITDTQARGVKDGSVQSFRAVMNHLAEFFGETKNVAAIGVDDLTRWRNQRTGRGGKPALPATLRRETVICSMLFNFCLNRNWVPTNPAKKLTAVVGESAPTMPFTDEEVRALMEACDRLGTDGDPKTAFARKRARAFLGVLLYTGLRIGDAVGLRRRSLNWETRHITLRTTKKDVPVKIQIPEHVVDELTSLPVAHPDYFFFPGRRLVTTKRHFQTIVSRIGEIAGVHAHGHRFRDTFARGVLEGGADMRTLQILLGHGSIKTTEKHYAQFLPSQQRILDAATAALDFGERSAAAPALMKGRQGARGNTKKTAATGS